MSNDHFICDFCGEQHSKFEHKPHHCSKCQSILCMSCYKGQGHMWGVKQAGGVLEGCDLCRGQAGVTLSQYLLGKLGLEVDAATEELRARQSLLGDPGVGSLIDEEQITRKIIEKQRRARSSSEWREAGLCWSLALNNQPWAWPWPPCCAGGTTS